MIRYLELRGRIGDWMGYTLSLRTIQEPELTKVILLSSKTDIKIHLIPALLTFTNHYITYINQILVY